MKGAIYLGLLAAAIALVGQPYTSDYGMTPGPPPAEADPGRQDGTDVAVAGISSPTEAVQQGDAVSVQITVANLGGSVQAVPVVLHNDTTGLRLHGITVTLEAGASLDVGFTWDTTRVADGSYTLTASVALEDDQDPANNSLSLAAPVTVEQTSIIVGDAAGLELPDASFGGVLTPPSIDTSAVPLKTFFVGNPQAAFSRPLAPTSIDTGAASLQQVFVANAAAAFQGGTAAQQPFLQSHVRGRVHLQGRDSSRGGYVQVGDIVHFLAADGSFNISVPAGPVTATINAPGYVPVSIPEVQVPPGEVLTVPELTLPFGDANGDGKVDILDLSLAGGNFGAATEEVTVP